MASVSLVLIAYACARILQVIFGPTPTTTLVAFEVLAAFAFALVDGARLLGIRGILSFATTCVLVGNVSESIGTATGFPFGHYAFTDLMGPKLFSVPILLGLAYVGMAYVSWMMAQAICGPAGHGTEGVRLFTVPLVASFVMVSWDLAQDPVWSTMLQAWVWRDGGPWFGVPLLNYFGWFLTILSIYVLFAFVCRRFPMKFNLQPRSSAPSLIFYALCAGGNCLQVFTRRIAIEAYDGSGRAWRTDDILAASALVSLLVMGGWIAIAISSVQMTGRAKD